MSDEEWDEFVVRLVLGQVNTHLKTNSNSSEYEFYLKLKEKLERLLQDKEGRVD